MALKFTSVAYMILEEKKEYTIKKDKKIIEQKLMCKQTDNVTINYTTIAMQNYCTKTEPVKCMYIQETLKALTGTWRKDLKNVTICYIMPNHTTQCKIWAW